MSNPPEILSKGAEEKLSKLKEKLRELFQLNRGDLDFGLYRIMALKGAEINEFINEHLLPQVTETLGDIAKSDISLLEADLEKATSDAQGPGVDPEATPKVKELKARIKAAKGDQQADTYNHLFNFFSRYYDEGDFMSLRRYKSGGKEAYSIPYNGEEVKLYWANSDQYYIKTTENYSSYVFTLGDGKRRVCFEIAAADNEKDNIKESNDKQRLFVLAKDFIKVGANKLIIRLDHRPLTEGEEKKHPKTGIKRQHSINRETEQRILAKIKDAKGGWLALIAAPCPTEADENRTLLGKHLTDYAAKNSFDYFIHKDLGGFLRRELDNYLKSEVISIDNLELSDDPIVFMRNLAQIKAIKNVGNKIIDFLAQLEDFQKQLWLKKKFVLETQYCVTLDKVPESLYAEIAKNKAQHDEWAKLFSIDELKGDIVTTAYSTPLKPKFLKENPYLVLDTRHFNQAFKDKLLAALSDAGPIEEQLNGLLVHGENFQALNLLQERYRGQVKCVYIDPPYNTDMSPILYKNDYRHASWMSLITQGIDLINEYLNIAGVLSVAIDDEEIYRLKMLMDDSIGSDRYIGTVAVQSNPGGRDINSHFATSHDYCLFYANSAHKEMLLPRDSEEGEENVGGFRRTGGLSSPKEREKSEFAFYCDFNELTILGIGGQRLLAYPAEYEPTCIYSIGSDGNIIELAPEEFKKKHPNINVILPKFKNGDRGVWRWSNREKILDAVREGNVFLQPGRDSNVTVKLRSLVRSTYKPKTIWSDSKYSSTTYGTMLLQKIFGAKNVFSYPKSVHATQTAIETATYGFEDSLVLDYFAGSGTTGHAVINLNREDGEGRRYILVEVAHYFDTVVLPRMKKVIYSKEWKDGKPQGRKGISQLFKYMRLESYEDTLDSLTVQPRKGPLEAVENKKFIEDYLLRYALREETATSASLLGQDFIDPFNYTLSVVRDGVRRDAPVDLVETFNFLLGLQLATRRQIEGVLTITGTNAKGENCLVLWRNIEKIDASKLDKWFGKHRKTFANDLNLVYVNGDHTLNALRKSGDHWEAITTEPVFRGLMFGDE